MLHFARLDRPPAAWALVVTAIALGACTDESPGDTCACGPEYICLAGACARVCVSSDACASEGSDLACVEGVCTRVGTTPCPPSVDCDDGDPCTADGCDAAGICTHGAITQCCVEPTDCDDGKDYTDDACSDSAVAAHKTCTHTYHVDRCDDVAQCNDGRDYTDDDCDTSTHTCANVPQTGRCRSDDDCTSADGPHCDPTSNFCEACTSTEHCNDGKDYTTDACNADGPGTSACAWSYHEGRCDDAGQCNDLPGKPFCDIRAHSCEACTVNGDCDDAKSYTTDVCDRSGGSGQYACAFTLQAGRCENEADCAGVPGKPECRVATHTCEECVFAADCGDVLQCSQTTFTCVCNDNGCPDSTECAGEGACTVIPYGYHLCGDAECYFCCEAWAEVIDGSPRAKVSAYEDDIGDGCWTAWDPDGYASCTYGGVSASADATSGVGVALDCDLPGTADDCTAVVSLHDSITAQQTCTGSSSTATAAARMTGSVLEVRIYGNSNGTPCLPDSWVGATVGTEVTCTADSLTASARVTTAGIDLTTNLGATAACTTDSSWHRDSTYWQ